MPKAKKAVMGRPSYIHDRERIGRLIAAIQSGNWLVTACKLAGIRYTTVRAWIIRGEEAREAYESGVGIKDSERVFLDFLEEYEVADSLAEATVVASLMQQARLNPTASVGMLKMRWPQNWREQPVRVEVDVRQVAEKVAEQMGIDDVDGLIAEAERIVSKE